MAVNPVQSINGTTGEDRTNTAKVTQKSSSEPLALESYWISSIPCSIFRALTRFIGRSPVMKRLCAHASRAALFMA